MQVTKTQVNCGSGWLIRLGYTVYCIEDCVHAKHGMLLICTLLVGGFIRGGSDWYCAKICSESTPLPLAISVNKKGDLVNSPDQGWICKLNSGIC